MAKTGPKHREDKELIAWLRSRVSVLEVEKSQKNRTGLSDSFRAMIVLDEMCKFMKKEEDDFHRCLKEISMHEFHRHIMKIINKQDI